MAEGSVDVRTIAAWLGLSRERVRALVDEGMPRVAGGRYPLRACVTWYCQFARDVAKRRMKPGDQGGADPLRLARAELLAIEKRRALIDLQEREEEAAIGGASLRRSNRSSGSGQAGS